MAKSPQMVATLDDISKSLFGGHSRSTSIASATCVICGENASSFRDALSKREFAISGLCQECQDSVFGAPDGD